MSTVLAVGTNSDRARDESFIPRHAHAHADRTRMRMPSSRSRIAMNGSLGGDMNAPESSDVDGEKWDESSEGRGVPTRTKNPA